MSTRPLVSIGLPAFKGKFLKEMLLSLKAQTYAHFEVLIQDDASPDNLERIVHETCGEDGRFSYRRSAVNSSPDFVRNWNETLGRAQGEFFVLASDDDIYEPTFLQELVALATANPQCDLFCSPVRSFYPDGSVHEHPLSSKNETQIGLAYKLLVTNELFTVVPNYLVRTRPLKEIGGFLDLPAAWGSDWWTWCRLAKNGLIRTDAYLFNWRTSGVNISSVESDYWLEQKVLALKKGDPIWRLLIFSMVATNEEDERRLDILKEMYRTHAHYGGIEGVILKMRLDRCIRMLYGQIREAECTLGHAVHLLCRRARQFVHRKRAGAI